MPQIKTTYRFKGDDREWEETEIIEPVSNAEFFVRNCNNDYNANKPDDEPERELLRVEVLNPWLHLHSYRKYPGFDYFICNLCGLEVSKRGNIFVPFGGWTLDNQYCKEKLPSLPKLKIPKVTRKDRVMIEDEPDQTGLKKLPKLKF